MASSLFPDPLQMWREAVSKLESDVNSLTTGSMQSEEVVRSLHQFSSAALSVQQMFEKVIGGYLRRANLPSRQDILELGESLRRIEDKLDRVLPQEAQSVPAPRPTRTRRPPGAASAKASVSAPEPTPEQEPAPAPEPAPAAPAVVPAARRARRSKRVDKG